MLNKIAEMKEKLLRRHFMMDNRLDSKTFSDILNTGVLGSPRMPEIHVTDSLNLVNCYVSNFPKKLTVRGMFQLSGIEIRDEESLILPDELKVTASFFIENNKYITKLPETLCIGEVYDNVLSAEGEFFIYNCPNLVCFPKKISIIENCHIKVEDCIELKDIDSLENHVGRSLRLKSCISLKALPPGLVLDVLELDYCEDITSLPKDLIVNKKLVIKNMGHRDIPNGAQDCALVVDERFVKEIPREELPLYLQIADYNNYPEGSVVPDLFMKRLTQGN